MPATDLVVLLDRVMSSAPVDPATRIAALRELDAVARDPGRELDSHLRHYLQQRSYAKARAFLAGSAATD